MKAKIRSFITLGLTAVMTFSMVACRNDEVVKVPIDNGEGSTKPPYEIVENKYFVEDGKTDYVLLYPENATANELSAVSEMEIFFEEAIAADVQTYTDAQTLPEGKKFISIGDTSSAKSALGTDGSQLEQESFRIVTKEDNVYIIGEGHGVIWGAYQLLNYMFNYEFYKADAYTLDTGVTELNYFDIDETQVPDIDFFPSLYHGLRGDTTNSMRYRHTNEWEIMVGKQYHNSFIVLNPDVYYAEHYKWYNTTKTQLCYTAHGDEAELEAMIAAAVEYYVREFTLAPTKTYAAFIMQDNRDWCDCDACVASKEKYGAQSVAQLTMAHRIREGIMEKLAEQGDDRVIKVVTMIYYQCEDVPAVWSETEGKYVLTDPTLDFEGVVPFWAAMERKEHEKPWSDPENQTAVKILTQINDLFDEFWIWDYAINFHDYMVPFNSFATMSEDFEFLSQFNIGYYLYQCDHDAGNTTGFGALKTYLVSKLRWDADLDIKELTDNYFRAVYGPGSVAMKQIYNQYLVLAALNAAGYTDANGTEIVGWDQSIYSGSVTNSVYWPKGILNEWLDLIDESYAAIEYLKETDKAKYDLYEYNIRMESIFVRYLYAINYMTANNQENIQFKNELLNDVTSNFNRFGENNKTVDMFASLLGLE